MLMYVVSTGLVYGMRRNSVMLSSEFLVWEQGERCYNDGLTHRLFQSVSRNVNAEPIPWDLGIWR